jgi:alkyldihydroxyacetonephosphate synthase
MARSLWAWGREEAFPSEQERKDLAAQVGFILGIDPPSPRPLPERSAARVSPSRLGLDLPFTTTGALDRAAAARGRSFPEILAAFNNDFTNAPDVVARPASEEQLARVLERAAQKDVVIVPYGGGTSVVRGISYEGERPWCSVDMRALDRVIEIDDVSLAARIGAGASGPRIEEQLGARGLSLRFYPQSFELSTLGGWIATRAAGHYATGRTHIDDLVESVRVLGPTGAWSTRRLPTSGAGPDPNRLVLGSEGTLGFITEAWVRVVRRPRFKAQASLLFTSIDRAIDAVRAVAQSGLLPSNCRLLDDKEALFNRVTQGEAVLLLGFESADHEVTQSIERAVKLAIFAGGRLSDKGIAIMRAGGVRDEASSIWRSAFLRGPYLQSALVSLGLVCDTFETACTWDRVGRLRSEVMGAVRDAFDRENARGEITMRLSHAYPDGAAPYFTFVGTPGKDGAVGTWSAIKKAASDAIERAGGTITHHHAVGRLHRPWYDRERPDPFAAALRAAKSALDPQGIMNPGVLL